MLSEDVHMCATTFGFLSAILQGKALSLEIGPGTTTVVQYLYVVFVVANHRIAVTVFELFRWWNDLTGEYKCIISRMKRYFACAGKVIGYDVLVTITKAGADFVKRLHQRFVQ